MTAENKLSAVICFYLTETIFMNQRACVYTSTSLRLHINEPAFTHQRACVYTSMSLRF